MSDAQAPTTSVDTVEAVVRSQLSKALGGRRGMVEAAVPTIMFTILWLTTKELQTALVVSVAAALVLLVARLVQRSTVQFVLNALFGIGIGWFFVTMSARSGGSADDQALAYFLPGIIYNSGYSVVLVFTILIGWPIVGFMVGSVTGDPTAWHEDKQVVRLCSLLTWVLVAPCLIRVAGSGSTVVRRQVGGAGGRHRGRGAGHREDLHGLAAPAGRAGRDGGPAGTRPDAGRAGARTGLTGQPPCRLGASSRSSSSSTSADTTNSSSSPDSTGWSASGG